jgi:hypothetical protein
VFHGIPEDRPTDLAEVYQQLLRCGDLAAYEAPSRFYEIGSVEGIRELDDFMRGGGPELSFPGTSAV